MSRIQPSFPTAIATSEDKAQYQKRLYDDLYPKITPFNPVITGLTGGTVSGLSIRQARMWTLSITIAGVSTASGASFQLPFTPFATTLCSVKSGSTMLAGSSNGDTMNLPDWSGVSDVVLEIKGCE